MVEFDKKGKRLKVVFTYTWYGTREKFGTWKSKGFDRWFEGHIVTYIPEDIDRGFVENFLIELYKWIVRRKRYGRGLPIIDLPNLLEEMPAEALEIGKEPFSFACGEKAVTKDEHIKNVREETGIELKENEVFFSADLVDHTYGGGFVVPVQGIRDDFVEFSPEEVVREFIDVGFIFSEKGAGKRAKEKISRRRKGEKIGKGQETL